MIDPIDFRHLESYVGGDHAIAREVLILFCDQARAAPGQLDPEGSPEAWRQAAHLLRGSALGIGATALAEACGEAEQKRDAGAAEKRAARARIIDCVDSALADIAAYTGPDRAA